MFDVWSVEVYATPDLQTFIAELRQDGVVQDISGTGLTATGALHDLAKQMVEKEKTVQSLLNLTRVQPPGRGATSGAS